MSKRECCESNGCAGLKIRVGVTGLTIGVCDYVAGVVFWVLVVGLCTSGDLGFGWGWLVFLGPGWLAGRWLGLVGAWSRTVHWTNWAGCHRFHFFGCFYGICDTIGRDPVTDSIFFFIFMESATNPRSTIVYNMGCCHKFRWNGLVLWNLRHSA